VDDNWIESNKIKKSIFKMEVLLSTLELSIRILQNSIE
jgi:hypothetical protein